MKKAMLSVVALLALAGMCSAGTVTWENYLAYVYARPADGGGLIPKANNWVIALYADAGNDNIMDDWNPLAVPIVTRQGPAWADNGYFSTQFTSDGGIKVFTRIYNSSDINTATWYVNLNGGVKTLPVLPLPTDTTSYDPGGSAPDGSDWRPIPEPASLALFGLGLATMLVGRRLRK